MAALHALVTYVPRKLAERARAHGGGAVKGPHDMPWDARDLKAPTLDVYPLVFIGRRLPRARRTVQRGAHEHGL